MNRYPSRLFAVAVTALLLALTGAAQAQALPIPTPIDCMRAPSAEDAGSGITQYFDPPPAPTPARADPFAKGSGATVYGQFGYSGFSWTAYDAGCIPDLGVTTDTMVGNMLMSAATWGVSVSNGLHARVANPGQFMGPLDDLVTTVTAQLKASLWDTWGRLALLALVVILIALSMGGHLNKVVNRAGWALLVAVAVVFITNAPMTAAGYFDQGVTAADSALAVGVARGSGQDGNQAALASNAVAVNELLYKGWLRGAFPSDTSASALTYGPQLFKAQANTWANVSESKKDPVAGGKVAAQKKAVWAKVAADVQAKDPAAYESLKGTSRNRIATGFMTCIGVFFTNIFTIVADLFRLFSEVVGRFLIMFSPAIAVIAVISWTSIRRFLNVAWGVVANVVIFSLGAAVHRAAVSALLTSSSQGGSAVMAGFLIVIVTVGAFALLWPYLSLSFAGRGGAAGGARKVKRWATRQAADVSLPAVIPAGLVEEMVERTGKREVPNGDGDIREQDTVKVTRREPVAVPEQESLPWHVNTDPAPKPAPLDAPAYALAAARAAAHPLPDVFDPSAASRDGRDS